MTRRFHFLFLILSSI